VIRLKVRHAQLRAARLTDGPDAFETPEILDQIPVGEELIILPENDPELSKANQETLEGLRRQGKPCIVTHLRKLERILPCMEVAAE